MGLAVTGHVALTEQESACPCLCPPEHRRWVEWLLWAKDAGGWGQESEILVSALCLMICNHLGQPLPLPGPPLSPRE